MRTRMPAPRPLSAVVTKTSTRLEREATRLARMVVGPSAGAPLSEVSPAVAATREAPSGAELPPELRHFFGARLGHDFASVRIHARGEPAARARSVGARAFTAGHHIAFAPGEYQPQMLRGLELLAHELAHVVQQSTGRDGGVPAVQFDLARPVPNPGAAPAPLTEEQVRIAIRYNRARFEDPYVFAVMRDVLGVPRFPAIVDEEFVHAIALWQAQHNLTVDGRLTGRTTATIVAELRAEGALVPSLLRDAVRVELEAAYTFNEQRNFDAQTIRILQRVVGAPITGAWEDATIQRMMLFQRTNALEPDGMVGPATLRALLETLVAASEFDDAIHMIVDAFDFPTANLAAITFDASVTGADAITTGTIGAGQPQTVRVGPSTFTAGYEHMIRIIGHELQHVQQRSGATPITNQRVREFLAFAWEALSTGSPPLSPADRVTHAQIAIQHWNQAPVAERTPHQDIRDRLDRLNAAGGVGNF